MIVAIVTYSGTVKLLYTRTQVEKLGSIEKRAKEIIGSEINIPPTYLHKLMKMKACMIVKKCLVNDICSNFCGYFQVNNHDKHGGRKRQQIRQGSINFLSLVRNITKLSDRIELVIPKNRMFFVFRYCYILAGK